MYNVSRILVDNIIDDYSDIVGVTPIAAAPAAFLFLT